MNDEKGADTGQCGVDVFEERVAVEAVVDGASQEYGDDGERQREQVVVGDGRGPETGEPIAGDADEAGCRKYPCKVARKF